MSTDILYEFQGERTQHPGRWDLIDASVHEIDLVKAMREYSDWRARGKGTGWAGFRIVKVTTSREVIQ